MSHPRLIEAPVCRGSRAACSIAGRKHGAVDSSVSWYRAGFAGWHGVSFSPDPFDHVATRATVVGMVFSDEELEYLRSHPLARVASVAADGQPDVTPVALEVDGTTLWLCGAGDAVLRTRKIRNIMADCRKVAPVVDDDVVSFEPFIARNIRIYGTAENPIERVGMVGPGHYVRVAPSVSWSWNLEAAPVGDSWYEPHRTVHRPSSERFHPRRHLTSRAGNRQRRAVRRCWDSVAGRCSVAAFGRRSHVLVSHGETCRWPTSEECGDSAHSVEAHRDRASD
jgi:pyridoxamine 5'-phosphate oxidase family protein